MQGAPTRRSCATSRRRNAADEVLFKKNEPGGSRTLDNCLKRAVLYQLSYRLSKIFLGVKQFVLFGFLYLIDLLDVAIGEFLNIFLVLAALVFGGRLVFLSGFDALV